MLLNQDGDPITTKHGDVTVEIGAPGSGDNLVEAYKKEEAGNLTRDQKYMASLLCHFAAMTRLWGLEVEQMKNLVLTPEKLNELQALRNWYDQLGIENQMRLAAKIYDLSRQVEHMTGVF